MNDLPPYLLRLRDEQRLILSQLPVSSRKLLRPLFDGGVLLKQKSGAGEVIVVQIMESFVAWISQQYPSAGRTWTSPEDATRARAVARRRNSKSGGNGVAQGMLHMRTIGAPTAAVMVDSRALPVATMTADYGVAACLIAANTQLEFKGKVALIENLECFLQAGILLADVTLVLHSAGKVSDRLIKCLANAKFDSVPLLHLPDYDPVGLSDYLRLRTVLGEKVSLFVPGDLEDRFKQFGNHDLIAKKPRNRALLEQLNKLTWPCPESAHVFQLIKETGAGLEQESLLLRSP